MQVPGRGVPNAAVSGPPVQSSQRGGGSVWRWLALGFLALALPACPDPSCPGGNCALPIGLSCDVGDDSQCPGGQTCSPLTGSASLGTCVRVACDVPEACGSGTTCWPPPEAQSAIVDGRCEAPVTCGDAGGQACSDGVCKDGMTCGEVFVMSDGGVPEATCACVP